MLYLIYGTSPLFEMECEKLIDKIKSENVGINTKIFDANIKEVEDFLLAISQNSMFAPKELIILKRCEEYKKLADLGKILKDYNMSQKEIVITYEEYLNDYGKIKNEIPKKVISNFKETSKILEYRGNVGDSLIHYIQQNLNISKGESRELLSLIGEDYNVVKNEISKINNFLDGEKYDLNKVKPILVIDQKVNLQELIKNYLLKNETIPLAEYVKGEKLHMLFIYTIMEEFLIYLKLKLLCTDKLNPRISYNELKNNAYDDIKKYFKNSRGYTHPYVLFTKMKDLNRFDTNDLKNKISRLLKIEYNMKQGIGDMEVATELFILNK